VTNIFCIYYGRWAPLTCFNQCIFFPSLYIYIHIHTETVLHACRYLIGWVFLWRFICEVKTAKKGATVHRQPRLILYGMFMLGWLPLMCNNHWQLQQLQLELHQPCAPTQDVKGWQPPLLKKSWSWQPPLLKKCWSWWHHSCL